METHQHNPSTARSPPAAIYATGASDSTAYTVLRQAISLGGCSITVRLNHWQPVLVVGLPLPSRVYYTNVILCYCYRLSEQV